jgi:peptidoglycan hydrolase-like protein with peptidoglycan-binding domain
VQSGSTGDAVRAAQAELTAHGTSTPVTGTFDATTATNLRAFQTASGLPVTGTTDLDTWRDLVN